MLAATAPVDFHAYSAATRRRNLQDRTSDLSCQGLRGPAIASALGVSERTGGSWLAASRREVADEPRERYADELLPAVEAICHVAATALYVYERETARDSVRDTAPAPITPTTSTAPPTPLIPVLPRRAPHAPRYRSLVLAAHVQTVRLLGHYRRDVQRASATPSPILPSPSTSKTRSP